MTETIRRVVMGETGPGTAAFTHVEQVEPRIRPGGSSDRVYDVWGYDETPELPWHDLAPYVARSLFPAPGGLRVIAITFAGKESPEPDPRDVDAAAAEGARLETAEPAGLTGFPGPPGTHSSDSIDVGIVLSGRIATITPDGTLEILVPGDIYVQNGAPHAWENADEGPSTIVFVVAGAERRASSATS